MTLQDIIDEGRSDLDDETIPYLWSNTDFARYANRVVEILCEKAFLISDESTVAVCRFAVRNGVASYTKHTKIVLVRELRLDGVPKPLERATFDWLKNHRPFWRSETPGQPVGFAEDIETGKVTLIPTPNAEFTGWMNVYRHPLTPLSASNLGASPEIHARFHKYIKEGILWQAYTKQDTECYDPQKADKYKILFDRNCNKAFNEAYQAGYSSQTVGVHKGFV